MSRGVNHPRDDVQEHRGARQQARKLRVDWHDLQFIETRYGFHRKLKITHVPTGVSVEADGYHVGGHELRDLIYPALVKAIARYRPDKEPAATVSGVSTEVPPDEQQESASDGEPEDPADGE